MIEEIAFLVYPIVWVVFGLVLIITSLLNIHFKFYRFFLIKTFEKGKIFNLVLGIISVVTGIGAGIYWHLL